MAKPTITINEPEPYHFGQQMTFTIEQDRTEKPWVANRCYQEVDGKPTLVYNEFRGFYPEYTRGQTFTLGPTEDWTGGAAEGEAELQVFNQTTGQPRVVARVTYHVEA